MVVQYDSPMGEMSDADADLDWEILLDEVRGCLNFHSSMDGDDRIAFASKLRLLASREDRAGIYQRRFQGPTPDTPRLGCTRE